MTITKPSVALLQRKQELAAQMLAQIESAATPADGTSAMAELTASPTRRWNAMARKALIAEGKLKSLGGANGTHSQPRNDWARGVVEAARTRFLTAGAPVRRDEYWRYTDPAKCIAVASTNGAARGEPEPTSDTSAGDVGAEPTTASPISLAPLNELDLPVVTVTDSGIDLRGELPAGIAIESLTAALAAPDHWARELFGVLESAGQQPVARPLAALNTATAEVGAVIRVTGQVAQPLRVVRDATPRGGTCLGRLLIQVAPGGALTLVDSDVGAGRRNLVVEADIGRDARLNFIRAQAEDVQVETTANFVRLAENAEFHGFALIVDGELTRNETVMTLVGAGARANVAGGVLGRAGAVADTTVFVTHVAENCESRQIFKSVLDEGARSVFQGKVLVEQDAQKTDGYQIAQAVLLDAHSEFDSKPELEIYADDVKCSHGSTAGALDDDALFYLRSRGLDRREAESLLVAAFVDEAIAEIEHAEIAAAMRTLCAAWMERRQQLNA